MSSWTFSRHFSGLQSKAMTLLTFPENKECSWVAYHCRDPRAQPSYFDREHPEDAGSSAKLWFILEYLNAARALLVMLLTSLLMGNGCLNSPHPGNTEQQLINADKTTFSQPSYYWEVKMAAIVTEGHKATFPWKVTSPLIRVWRHITAASDPETVPSSQSPFPAVSKPRSWSQSCRASETQIVAGPCTHFPHTLNYASNWEPPATTFCLNSSHLFCISTSGFDP